MVLSANFFVSTGILVTFCVSDVRSHAISLQLDHKDNINTKIRRNDVDTFPSTIQSKNSVTPSTLSSTTSPRTDIESNSILTNFTSNVDESPPKSTPPSTIHKKATPSSNKQSVVESPHELSVANVERFVKSYFARNSRNVSAKSTEAPSVEHILHVISLSTDGSPTAAVGDTSKNSDDDIIANIPPGPAAAPLAAEKKRIALSAGNIIGIVFGVVVLMVGFIYVGMSYFPKARRRSSYTEMFINDAENDEEIALADYSEARANN